jgi:protein SCO1
VRRILILAGIAAICLSVGCQRAHEKHYPVQGEVISVDVPTQMIMLKHGDIPGFMPAMTMDYKVADAKQMAELKPGDTISADLVVRENIGHLEKIVVLTKAAPPPAATQ